MELNMKRIRVLMSIMLTAFGVAIAISWAFWGNITQAVAQSRVSEDGKYQLSADGKKLEIFLGEKEVSFAVPDGVETIGYSAFGPAFKLRSLVIPASVGVIEENAFPNCSELTSFEVAENNRAFRSIEGVLFSKDGKTLVRYPQGKKSDVYYVPRGVETIEPGAFEDCRSLKAVVFPNGVKKIGARAFYGCVPLRSLAFPASLESVGESAFDYCLLLSSVLVAEDNPNYRSIDRVLFSKDGKTALYYPQGKEQVKYAISKTLKTSPKTRLSWPPNWKRSRSIGIPTIFV